jgi:putative membrane protein
LTIAPRAEGRASRFTEEEYAMKQVHVSCLLAGTLVATGLLSGCDRRTEPSLPPAKSSGSPGKPAMPPSTPGTNSSNMPDRPSTGHASTAQVVRVAGTMGGKAVSANDVEFVSTAASATTLEVEASRVALQKTKTPAIGNFAQKMVDDHSRVGAELRALNLASSVSNVATMNPKDSDQLRKLKELQGRDFEREYIAQIGVAGHQEAVNAFQKAADTATDPQLKTLAP